MAMRPPPPGATFAFETSARSLEEQLGRIGALDTKAGILLAADGVLAGFLFRGDSALLQAPRGVVIASAMALVVSIMLALVSFLNRRYAEAPTAELVIRLMAADEAWLRWRFLGNMLEALATNKSKLERKARFLSLAIFSLIVTVGVIGGYLISALASDRIGG